MSSQLISTMIHPDRFTQWTGVKRGEQAVWTPGVLEYAVKALEGCTVLVELDRSTGHCAEGVLKGVLPGGGGRLPRLSVKMTGANPGEPVQEWTTNYIVHDIGTIVPLNDLREPGHNAKWTMHKMMHDDASGTLAKAKAALNAENWYGTWSHRVTGLGRIWWECKPYESTVRIPDGYVEPPRWGRGVEVQVDPAEVS